jgi:glutamate racemase
VILPGARFALERSRNRRIGIIGTNATIRSQAYNRAILARDDTIKVFARACPLLVPLVEEGRLQDKVTTLVLSEYLRPLLRHRIDTLVLGCTHYPLLKPAIQRVTGQKVALVDSAEACAAYVRERLLHLGLLAKKRRRLGTIQPFVTDEVERFEDWAQRFLGESTAPARQVDLSADVHSLGHS